MSWVCYSCSAENKNEADTCVKCGGSVAAPSTFYMGWVVGAAVFFMVFYLAGLFVGGTLLEFAANPSEAEIVAMANSQGVLDTKVATLDPEQFKAAKMAAIEKTKAEMPVIVSGLLYWLLPSILFLICGAIVGFVSEGRTVIEAGIGSTVGQVGGFMIMKYLLDYEIGWLALAAGLVAGFMLAIGGAWLGEAIQEKRERAGI